MVRYNEFRADRLAEFSAPYQCAHCGHRAVGRAYAYGQGTGISPLELDDDGAARRAASGATRAAQAQAHFSISIARCPACGKRDTRPIRALHMGSLVLCLLLLGAAIGFFLLTGSRWQEAVFLGAIIGGIPAALLWKHRAARVFSKQVTFDPPPAA